MTRNHFKTELENYGDNQRLKDCSACSGLGRDRTPFQPSLLIAFLDRSAYIARAFVDLLSAYRRLLLISQYSECC
jgi:hypothetical protein